MTKATARGQAADAATGGAGSTVRHVAIIMDGNGRWAKKRHLPRALGHKKGVEAVRSIVRAAGDMRLEALSLYAFSSENWKRPEDEVNDLMGLLRGYIRSDLQEFIDNGVKLKVLGDYKAFAPDIVELLDDALMKTAGGNGPTLAVALNYGAQAELVQAAKAAAAKGDISAAAIEAELYTAGLPPLDLVIRTSGEQRLSNFLLWQAAYAEFWFTETLWPDFSPDDFASALAEFADRERRFGGR